MSSMKTIETDILIIGSGAAGMAAAEAASRAGAGVILIDERSVPGGILNQCVHRGFGLGRYGKEMSGPEYAKALYRTLMETSAIYMPDLRVLSLKAGKMAVVSGHGELFKTAFSECVIAAGCMERTIWSLPVSGTRPEGVYTAGEVQEMIELDSLDIGSRVIILGSGDIGQIMARRLVQLGKRVIRMVEKRSKLGGMARNQEECVRAYNIPVKFNSTVTRIHGYPRLTGVTLRDFEADTDEYVECDTLITALGLIPDKTLAEELKVRKGESDKSDKSDKSDEIGKNDEIDKNDENGSPDWLHFTGNADFIHEIADSASAHAEKLGKKLSERILRLRQ